MGDFMNLSVKGFGMFGSTNFGLSPGGGLPGMHDMTLKSTQEAAQRAQKAAGQVNYWEQRMAGLKEMECGSVEEIAGKLEMLHTYEGEIAAAKAAFNQEQMFHLLDEAKERGEKIAEALEKMEPKTPEERQEEIAEEALGTEDSGGMLEEILEEAEEVLEEIGEEVLEETTEELSEELAEQEAAEQEAAQQATAGEGKMAYRPFDMRA